MGIGRLFVASAAYQGIGTGSADQRVIACAAVQHIGIGVAKERIVVSGAEEVGDARQHIARSVSARADGAVKVHGNRSRGCRVIGGVSAATAGERIGTRAADQRVVAQAAVERVGIGIAGQRVVVGRADQAGNAAVAVACGIASVASGVGQAGDDRCTGGGV